MHAIQTLLVQNLVFKMLLMIHLLEQYTIIYILSLVVINSYSAEK